MTYTSCELILIFKDLKRYWGDIQIRIHATVNHPPLEFQDIGLKNPGLILKHSRLAVPGLEFNFYRIHRFSEKRFKDAGYKC
jgi:hypothetical protein